MITFIIIVSGIYLILHIILFEGFRISAKLSYDNNYRPFVSVIIAARNEEVNIAKCLESLKKLTYPRNLFEIIIINDRSTDKTREIILRAIEGYGNFSLLDSSDNISSSFPGKANAVDCGIKESRGEIILMTDADCIVPVNWIEETVKYYKNGTGMVCGYTRINGENGFFAKIQSVDWLYLLTIAIGSSGFNRTLSCIGNNLSFRKKAYESTGGYEKIKYSVTEDLALMKAIRKKGYIIRYPVNPMAAVITDECGTFYELYSQKKRWFRGGTGIGIFGYFTGILMYIVNFVMISGFLYLPLIFYFSFLFIKFISDLIIIIPSGRAYNYTEYLKYFILFEVYFMLYGLLLPFTFLTGYKVKWKNRKV
jgi:cellulose synthase/poly-beta-1,6-N-acetylglucosamine synthase-like glycosyltransferase